MADEAYVQVAPDAGGKKVKNALLRGVLQPDGTYADVYVQCVQIVDDDGRSIDYGETNRLLAILIEEIRLVKRILAKANNDFVPVVNDGKGIL